jgi:hypothetical protein
MRRSCEKAEKEKIRRKIDQLKRMKEEDKGERGGEDSGASDPPSSPFFLNPDRPNFSKRE